MEFKNIKEKTTNIYKEEKAKRSQRKQNHVDGKLWNRDTEKRKIMK